MRGRPDPTRALHWPQEGGHAPGGHHAAQAQRSARRLQPQEKRVEGPPWLTAMA